MAVKPECIAMLLAGGQGSRLGILTKNIAKPAVPYGGKYRIILQAVLVAPLSTTMNIFSVFFPVSQSDDCCKYI